MIGRQDIGFSHQPTRAGVNEAMNERLRAYMTNTTDTKYPGEYYATVTLIKAGGEGEDQSILGGTRTVDGEKTQRGDYVSFNWADLTISVAGSYQFEVTIWEKPSASTTPTKFGSATSDYGTSIR